MKLSAQEEFGIRCLMSIAKNGSMTIPTLASKEGISQSHVAKILALLKRRGYITSTRGQIGGYALARSADKLFIKDILTSLGGNIYRGDFCERFSGQETECVHMDDCSIHPLWITIQSAIDRALTGMTLDDLVDPKAGINVRVYNGGRSQKAVMVD